MATTRAGRWIRADASEAPVPEETGASQRVTRLRLCCIGGRDEVVAGQ
jgi:hypothetical protein